MVGIFVGKRDGHVSGARDGRCCSDSTGSADELLDTGRAFAGVVGVTVLTTMSPGTAFDAPPPMSMIKG